MTDRDRDWIERVRDATRPEPLDALERQRMRAELRERFDEPRGFGWRWVGVGGLVTAAAALALALRFALPGADPGTPLPATSTALASWEAELLWPSEAAEHDAADDDESGWPDEYDAIDELWLDAGPPDERAAVSNDRNPEGSLT